MRQLSAEQLGMELLAAVKASDLAKVRMLLEESGSSIFKAAHRHSIIDRTIEKYNAEMLKLFLDKTSSTDERQKLREEIVERIYSHLRGYYIYKREMKAPTVENYVNFSRKIKATFCEEEGKELWEPFVGELADWSNVEVLEGLFQEGFMNPNCIDPYLPVSQLVRKAKQESKWSRNRDDSSPLVKDLEHLKKITLLFQYWKKSGKDVERFQQTMRDAFFFVQGSLGGGKKREAHSERRQNFNTYSEDDKKSFRDLLDWYLENGAEINPINDADERSVVSFLVAQGNTVLGAVMLAWLIEKGVELNTIDFSGRGPLYYVEAAKYIELLDPSLAEVNATDSGGMTPLHRLAMSGAGEPEMMEMLCARGANVNVKTQNEYTPLGLLFWNWSWCGSWENVLPRAMILRRYGADITAKDKDGKTPVDLFRSVQADEVRHYLPVSNKLISVLESMLFGGEVDLREKDEKGVCLLEDLIQNFPKAGDKKESILQLLDFIIRTQAHCLFTQDNKLDADLIKKLDEFEFPNDSSSRWCGLVNLVRSRRYLSFVYDNLLGEEFDPQKMLRDFYEEAVVRPALVQGDLDALFEGRHPLLSNNENAFHNFMFSVLRYEPSEMDYDHEFMYCEEHIAQHEQWIAEHKRFYVNYFAKKLHDKYLKEKELCESDPSDLKLSTLCLLISDTPENELLYRSNLSMLLSLKINKTIEGWTVADLIASYPKEIVEVVDDLAQFHEDYLEIKAPQNLLSALDFLRSQAEEFSAQPEEKNRGSRRPNFFEERRQSEFQEEESEEAFSGPANN